MSDSRCLFRPETELMANSIKTIYLTLKRRYIIFFRDFLSMKLSLSLLLTKQLR
jgi:hypothetical protein